MCAVVTGDFSEVGVGRARGRYFRENFAQGGVDLVQIIPELITNADAAIAASGRDSGRIVLSFGAPRPGFLESWGARMGSLHSPALLSWKHELRCTDDGEGVDADLVDMRLGALGVEPPNAGQRGMFGRGLRDVWLAQGAGRIEGFGMVGWWSRGSFRHRAMIRMRLCTFVTLLRRRPILRRLGLRCPAHG